MRDNLKRIRYIKQADGTHISCRRYMGAEDAYVSIIDGSKWFLKGTSSNIVCTGQATSPHKAKIAAKKAMEALGVCFNEELRGDTKAKRETNHQMR